VTAPASSDLVRVVVVDDSPVQRRFLRAAVDASTDLTVVGEARNGREAVALVARLRPAAVLMDLDLPVMSGIEAIERIMAASPTPILVYSAHVGGAESANALEALAAGAVDVLAKPGPDDKISLDDYADQVRKRLRVAARVRVITHPRGKLRSRGLAVGNGRPAVAGGLAPVAAMESRQGIRLIALGASTGGPQALHTVLKDLASDLQQAVVVVQHMAEGFIPGLVAWLDQLVPMSVHQAVDGGRLLPGTVTVAPSGCNLLVADDRMRLRLVPPEPNQFHVPGIDQCFRSIADTLGPDAVGVLLTGMGRDGAAGLKAMRDRGAATLGQDEATSTVYGMPKEAALIDAVDCQVPVDQIAAVLAGLVGRS
jgi:two-component system, chemotaxis family, protein-glutamate methylesterase/glutaminase